MGLASDLSYTIKPPNAFQRLVQRLAATRPGAWVFAKTLRHLDDLFAAVSHGRVSAPGLLAGLPVIDLTTTGRKSGQRRTSHLISVPLDDTLALLGTNFGQRSTPAWVLNLESDPHADVTFKGRSVPVLARPAGTAQYAEVLRRSTGVYGGYAKYAERITGRTVRIFVLEPLSPDAP